MATVKPMSYYKLAAPAGAFRVVKRTPVRPDGQIAPWLPTPPPPPANAPTSPLVPGLGQPYSDGQYWYKAAPSTKDADISYQDHVQQFVMNALIPAMDSITGKEAAVFLSRDNPKQYQHYSQINPTTSPALVQSQLKPYITQERINNLADKVKYDNVVSKLDNTTQTKLNESGQKVQKGDIQAGLTWLQEALRTAATGARGTTRQQQSLAAQHLNTLMSEAEKEPLRGGMYSTLFENLVNPIVSKAPASGILGRNRALSTPGGVFNRKGVAFRNPKLT